MFKALGYRTKDILAKFLLYGLVAGTVGTGIGTLLGHYVLSGTISQIITQGMVVGTSQQYFYGSYSLLALGLSLLSSVFPAYLVAIQYCARTPSVFVATSEFHPKGDR